MISDRAQTVFSCARSGETHETAFLDVIRLDAIQKRPRPNEGLAAWAAPRAPNPPKLEDIDDDRTCYTCHAGESAGARLEIADVFQGLALAAARRVHQVLAT